MDEFDPLGDISFDQYAPFDPGRAQVSPRCSLEPEEPGLPLLELADWQEDASYDGKPSTYVHYSIEWKLTYNGKVLSEDTDILAAILAA
ncbi:hypothetical protein RRF57_001800 [Xylaria bambusicola]|uniref:Uncharacterized protein n=1 Tax=Xylaria bambusicola TaxID=326684 RepID=A0AAN7U5G2_9PEZI